MQLSLNGQQFTSSVPITYLGLPVLHSISPSSGPLPGGTTVTVSGVYLQRGTNYTCGFGDLGHVAAIYEDGRVICQTPPSRAHHSEKVPLEISLDNVPYTSAGLLFQYSASEPLTLIPDRGSMTGGGLCTIQGHELHGGSHYMCSFGSAIEAATYDADRDEVRCIAPKANG